MNTDRRDAYYARSATRRAHCPLDFQRRYLAGLRVMAQMRARPSRFSTPIVAPVNVVAFGKPFRRKQA